MATATDTARLEVLERKMEALEQEVQLLQDYEGVRECLARYSFTCDLGLSEEYVDNFTEDGVIDLDKRRWTGKEQLADFIHNPRGHKSIEGRCTHASTNYFIRVNGHTAWAEGYLLLFENEADEFKVHACSYNHWDFEKQGDRWHIKYRYRRSVGGEEWGGKVIKSFVQA